MTFVREAETLTLSIDIRYMTCILLSNHAVHITVRPLSSLVDNLEISITQSPDCYIFHPIPVPALYACFIMLGREF